MMLTVYIKGNLYLYPLKTSLCIFFLLNLFFKMLAQNHLLPNAFWEHTPSLMDNRTIYLMHLCPTVSGSGIALSHVQIFAIPWTTAHQASLSHTVSQSLPKFMFIESVMLSNHLGSQLCAGCNPINKSIELICANQTKCIPLTEGFLTSTFVQSYKNSIQDFDILAKWLVTPPLGSSAGFARKRFKVWSELPSRRPWS